MIQNIIKATNVKMEKVIEDLRRNLAVLRTGRASVTLLDQINVDYYGTPTPLNQIGNVTAPDPTLLTIQPWDVSLLQDIEKSILASDLDLNPANDGKIIRIPIPPLTEERRKQLARQVGKILEEHRTALRNIRRTQNNEIKTMLQNKELSEDDERKGIGEIQEVTDRFVEKLQDFAKKKETEILTV
tara:strand:+ start:308 stop:865 length:558 start_codon:yes stop_codon:yes gene_type:complete